ncbi:MAG: helix-turn-helix transcriptional regulator [Bacteroidota bacterium]
MPLFTRFSLLIAIIVSGFTSCTAPNDIPAVDDMETAVTNYLTGWFDEQVHARLHYSSPGYCFRQIQQTVPQKWWRYATESLYYRLPEMPDSGETERWLDTAADILPDDNVRSFLQMIRGNRLVAAGNYNDALTCLQESHLLALQQKQLFRANDAKRYMARCLILQGEYPRAISLLTEEIASLQNLLDLKNQLISNLELQINSSPNQETITQPLRMLTEHDWHEFRESFEKQFPNYILRLKNTFPAITNSEIRLFIFIKIGLEHHQIANISGISPESVYKSRFRLRQKLSLDQSVSLDTFIGDF